MPYPPNVLKPSNYNREKERQKRAMGEGGYIRNEEEGMLFVLLLIDISSALARRDKIEQAAERKRG